MTMLNNLGLILSYFVLGIVLYKFLWLCWSRIRDSRKKKGQKQPIHYVYHTPHPNCRCHLIEPLEKDTKDDFMTMHDL
jgi:hypothetical protein